jgi:hypothetical protein
MKVQMVFDLPQDSEDYALAFHGHRYKRIIDEFDNFLRNKLKYGEITENENKIYSERREKLHEIRAEISE